MAAHTPGPWKAALTFIDNQPQRQRVCVNKWGGAIIADCGEDSETAAANARLLAGAPELLYLLTTILDVWDEHHIIGPTVYHDARAAIAKAS